MKAGRLGRAWMQAGHIRQAGRHGRAGRQESSNAGMEEQAEKAEQEDRQIRAGMQGGMAEETGK
jgi:hypothetical protein